MTQEEVFASREAFKARVNFSVAKEFFPQVV